MREARARACGDNYGFALPQIGSSQRGCILNLSALDRSGANTNPIRQSEIPTFERGADTYAYCANPIVKASGEKRRRKEECLSIGRRKFKVIRREWADIDGVHTGGLLAQAIQHENDHLDGIVGGK